MKKLLLQFLFGIVLTTTGLAQNAGTSGYFVSANAYSLLDSYRDLISKTNTGDLDYAKDNVSGTRRLVAASMPGKGFGGAVKGYVTFTSYYWTNYSFGANPLNLDSKIVTTAFHTQWYMENQVPTLFGAASSNEIFIPQPIVLNTNGGTQLYCALLVPVKTYQSSGLKDSVIQFKDDADYMNSPLVNIAINTADIKSINEVSMEGTNGFMSRNLPLRYNNVYSSIGVIVEVQLKNGETKKCYIFNNHEIADSRLVWKNKK
jgi:hypothetical protein